MSILSTIRLSLWGAAILFSVITLALAAHFTSVTLRPYVHYGYLTNYTYGGFYATFAAMAIATSALTLLTLPVFIGLDETRTGAPTSMIITEMVVVTILWILWLVTASLTVSYTSGVILGDCSIVTDSLATLCHEYKAIEAFSFLAWLCLMGYGFTLLVFTLIAHNRGHTSVWTQSIKETNFFAPPVSAGVAGGAAPAHQYPPAPYTSPGVLPPQQQQFQQQPVQQFQQQPFQQSQQQPVQQWRQQPLTQQQFQQQQFQQPPTQGGYPYPAGSPQPLQNAPVAQPGFNQV